MAISLTSAFAMDAVWDLAGDLWFARGVAYRQEGRVEPGERTVDRVRGVVRGTRPYQVELGVVGDEPAWSCSCPLGDDGHFCKHCVAVALEMVDSSSEQPMAPVGSEDGAEPDLAAYLATRDREELEALVLEAAGGDWKLRERLRAMAAAGDGTGLDRSTWERRVDVVFAPYDDFVSYREAPRWAGEVGEVLDALSDLASSGHAGDVIILAERAHRRADEAQQYIDDSGGELAWISEMIGDLHLSACVLAEPDPVALAGRLVDLELTSELDAFHGAAGRYADVLGRAGLDEYRCLLEPRWAAVADDPDGPWVNRYRLREAMAAVVKAQGDVDGLVAIRAQELNTAGAYLDVVRTMVDAGRIDEAIDWGQRGLDAHAERHWTVEDLVDTLAGLLVGVGRPDDADQTYWTAFERAPTLAGYRRLLAGVSGAPEPWAERSRAELRSRLDEPIDPAQNRRVTPSPPTVLVEILLYDGEADEAWAVAAEHGVDDRLWLGLAAAREQDHPLEVIPVYERDVEANIAKKKRWGYEQAVKGLERIELLALRADEPARFHEVVGRVRESHKAKRSLMAMLDQRGW